MPLFITIIKRQSKRVFRKECLYFYYRTINVNPCVNTLYSLKLSLSLFLGYGPRTLDYARDPESKNIIYLSPHAYRFARPGCGSTLKYMLQCCHIQPHSFADNNCACHSEEDEGCSRRRTGKPNTQPQPQMSTPSQATTISHTHTQLWVGGGSKYR